MPDYRLSRDAQIDLDKIADWGLDNFGMDRALSYRDSFVNAFERLARHNNLGSSFGHIRPDSRRLVHGSHVIYYKWIDEQIVIQRILHQSQDPLRHL